MKWVLITFLIMGSITIKPLNAEQKQAYEDISPNLLLWGQGGSGKTQIGASKPIIIGAKYSNNRIFLIRRKKVDLRATLWKRFTELFPPEYITNKDENQMIYKINNGTEYWGLGLDSVSDVNKLASTECGMAIVEEATEIEEKNFDEKIKRAVRLPTVPFHQTILLCNPNAPSHWIYNKFFMNKLPGYTEIFCKTLPSPYLPKSYYDWLNRLTGVFAQRYREGKWVGFEGLVYLFDPRMNIIPRFEIPSEWTRIISIDFGFAVTHPFVCQWWAISPENYWFRYREIYMSQRTVKKHSDDIKKYCEIDGIVPEAICDHDAEDRATLEENGIRVIPAIKDRLAGQQTVFDKFEHNQIFFLEDSLVEPDIDRQMQKLPIMTEQEFGTYMWANKGREDMIKNKDDGMDCMRYAIHTHYKNGMNGMRIRWA
jgi:phage terminase large subunit